MLHNNHSEIFKIGHTYISLIKSRIDVFLELGLDALEWIKVWPSHLWPKFTWWQPYYFFLLHVILEKKYQKQQLCSQEMLIWPSGRPQCDTLENITTIVVHHNWKYSTLLAYYIENQDCIEKKGFYQDFIKIDGYFVRKFHWRMVFPIFFRSQPFPQAN